MNVITIALGVALGLLLLEVVLRLPYALVVGAVEVYQHSQPERTYLHEFDPVDGSTIYTIDAENGEIGRVMDVFDVDRDTAEYMLSESVDVDRSDDNESQQAGDRDE